MSGSSPAHSSLSTTAFAGERNGGSNGAALSTDDFYFPSDLISIQDRKDEAMIVLKSNLMTALNKEVKSLDEDNWMFEGPRSRINLISRQGVFYRSVWGFQRIGIWLDQDDFQHLMEDAVFLLFVTLYDA